MEHLAKFGIILTNIGIGFTGLFLTFFMFGAMGVFGVIIALCITVGMSTTWWMMVSAYNKFMKS